MEVRVVLPLPLQRGWPRDRFGAWLFKRISLGARVPLDGAFPNYGMVSPDHKEEPK